MWRFTENWVVRGLGGLIWGKQVFWIETRIEKACCRVGSGVLVAGSVAWTQHYVCRGRRVGLIGLGEDIRRRVHWRGIEEI